MVQLTLMKSKEEIKATNKIPNSLLFRLRRKRNANFFHSRYVNTFAITNTINVGEQIIVDKFFGSKISIIES